MEPSPVLVPHAASEYHCTVMYPIDDECAHTMPVTIAACASAGLPAGTSRPYCERSTEHTLAFVAGLLQSMHLPVSTDQALVGVPEHVVSAAANEPYEVCEVLPGEPTVPPALLEGAGAGGKAVKVKVGVVGVGAAAGSGAGSATGAAVVLPLLPPDATHTYLEPNDPIDVHGAGAGVICAMSAMLLFSWLDLVLAAPCAAVHAESLYHCIVT